MSNDVEAEGELNLVTLRGRVSGPPTARDLPSGSSIVTVRLAMSRAKTHMTSGSKQTSDWVDCVAWSPRWRKSVGSWKPGDTVEVEGSLRRRFFRTEGGVPNSRVEVEVLKSRVITRAS